MSLRDRVKKALSKPSPYGVDIDISSYIIEEPQVFERSVEESVESKIGMRPSISQYLQLGQMALYKLIEKSLEKYGVKVVPLRVAIEKFDLARDLAWRLVDPDTDKYTALTYLYGGELGYFVYVPPEVKVPTPIYTCLVLRAERRAMLAHNVVYVDYGAEAHVVTGCTIPHGVKGGLHVGISEFYVGRDARLTFSMIHSWAEGLHVRPRTAAKVAEGGEYVSYYMIYSPVSSIQLFPRTILDMGAKLYAASVIVGRAHGNYDIGTKAQLEGTGSSAELVSRVVAFEDSKIYARGYIEGLAPESRGHIECLGLLASPNAEISSIPIVTSRNPQSILSHEAAIGIIAREEIEYLESKGFTEDEAKSIIIRGFMNIEAPGLPDMVKAQVKRLIDHIARAGVQL
ncbi:MAG: SufD family Fe-S cluster assembly protein [Acidilobaceae archaeon]